MLRMKEVTMMRPIKEALPLLLVLLIVALMFLGTGCARLSAQTPLAFWGGSTGGARVHSHWTHPPAGQSIGGGGTVGVSGGLFLDEFERT